MTRRDRAQADVVRRQPRSSAASPAHPLLALQKAAGNRAATIAVQRAAVTAKDLGAGPLQVDTGGDFDANHTAADWADAVKRSAARASLIRTNTIVKDADAFKAQVGGADYDSGFVKNGKFRDLRVPGIALWQIDTKAAAEGTLPTVEPPTSSRSVDVKNGLAAADGRQKSPGAYTRSATGPIFLATGIRKVL